MAFVIQEFLTITAASQVDAMAAFINANKPESLAKVSAVATNVSTAESYLIIYLNTDISSANQYGAVTYTIGLGQQYSPFSLTIRTYNSSSYFNRIMAYDGNNRHYGSYRIVCSDNCLAIMGWDSYVGVGQQHVMIISQTNDGDTCIFFNEGAVYNSPNNIYPNNLRSTIPESNTSTAQFRDWKLMFSGTGSGALTPPAINQTMLSNVPVWNNSVNRIRYMPHAFIASCVDSTYNAGGIVTVGDHEYYCCGYSRIFFD